ncbi:hypothetical protein LR48_Vigan477s000500 [Vigna angularis]|uniref:Uncharacterized protein n=2 Tax=Phaseolus angularis TaxID=3914 RepID=A0A0L9TBQ5_PHAAN|nr:uncharacterized protein LOC108321191 [Vigna angularis]KAG2380321.1 uncharacterized protein HKW66_Vig0171000 [Vigna angularis]KOM27978.1 hypothetical protein LR48_Vigan477s000500 [Vigna angularis]
MGEGARKQPEEGSLPSSISSRPKNTMGSCTNFGRAERRSWVGHLGEGSSCSQISRERGEVLNLLRDLELYDWRRWITNITKEVFKRCCRGDPLEQELEVADITE